MIRVQMWEYLWGHTSAQIDLMTIDAPFVAYKKREKTKEEKLKGYTREKAKRDYDRWLERKKNRKTNIESFLGKRNTNNAQSVTE